MNSRSRLLIGLIVIAVIVVAAALRVVGTDDAAGAPSTTAAPATTTTTASPTTTTSSTTTTLTPTSVGPTLAPGATACDPYGSISEAGAVVSDALIETSGIAASRTSPGVIWAHNDSGDEPTLYAVGPPGEHLGAFVAGGGLAFDWEDLAVGPGRDPDRTYLYVGDIGDNFGIRNGRITVYVIPEPDPTALPDSVSVERAIVLNTTDGPHDFESLFLADGAIYLVAKDAEATGVYRSASPVNTGDSMSLELVATLDLGAEVTGADISWDGSTLAFRGYETVWMWHRDPGSTIGEALATAPCTAPSPNEPQGEALTFLDNGAMVTISEGEHPTIHLIPRIP